MEINNLQVWSHFDPNAASNRYWCCFGTHPPGPQMINIDVEINPPFSSGSGHIAGAFVTSPDGDIYLAHSGGVGGGTKGVGKTQFLNFLRGAQPEAVFVEGKRKPREMLILGKLGSEELPVAVAHFAREVRRFKDMVGEGVFLPNPAHTFTPEPKSRSPYPLGGIVESRCLHAPIVDDLHAALEALGYSAANDRLRDQYIHEDGAVTHLFEVKTDLSTTSLYTAIGQLSLHGAAERKTPKRILVLPAAPDEDVAAAVARLNIDVLVYSWSGKSATFHDLSALLD